MDYLRRCGYTIVTTNFRKRYGEIDIIARHQDLLIFVEVKYRSTMTHGSALEAVDFRKQQRICKVAMAYLQTLQEGECSARFDVIAVYPAAEGKHTDMQARIEHIENAFDFCL